MALMIHWWVFVKLGLFLIGCIPVYKAIKTKFKNKVWVVLSVITIILFIVSPVKLDSTVQTRMVTTQSNTEIENSKVIPPKVEDNSFKTRTEAVKSITKEELK